MRTHIVSRIRFIAVACVIVAVIIIIRLYFLQVVHGEEYRDKAENQHVAPSANILNRGSIYFTNKNGTLISAATLASGYTVALIPIKIKDPAVTYEALNRIVPIDHAEYIVKAAKLDDPYEELARRVPEEVGRAVLDAEIPGVSAYRERWRYYPGQSLAAHEIGFIGFGAKGTEQTGQAGIERTYNTALTKPQVTGTANFFADLFSNVGTRFFSTEQGAGADVVTSIEPTVQAYLEDKLQAYSTTWQAQVVGGIIMDPKTGAIVAMASLPSFDPNDVKRADPKALRNLLTQGTYEFGSTMKPITMAAALDSGAITHSTTYNDTGTVILDKKTISNSDRKARGVVPMQEVLSRSLNVGIAWIVQKMGTETLQDYFDKFGITEETGIDLPGEASPQVAYLTTPRVVEFVTAGFGQGVSITPIAMTRALAALANRGMVPAPHVGRELRYPGGITKTLGWAPPRQALRPESAETITRMLVTVVDTALKGGNKRIVEMSIAAKTGTAQIANPAGGGYYADRYLHSFFGYFPAYEPRFIIFLFGVEPVGAQFASDTWTDPFFDMTKFLITYYAIPPDRALTTPNL